MIFWIDAQLPPAISEWIQEKFSVEAHALRHLGLRDASDREIFIAAKNARAIVITKDGDFLKLQEALGTPPQVIWVTCGNTSNARLKQILERTMAKAIELLTAGEALVEVSE